MLSEIVTRCEDANERLDAQAAAFDRLRDLERNAPQMVGEVERRVAASEGRLEQSVRTVQALGSRYADSALASVATNPQQATERLRCPGIAR